MIKLKKHIKLIMTFDYLILSKKIFIFFSSMSPTRVITELINQNLSITQTENNKILITSISKFYYKETQLVKQP